MKKYLKCKVCQKKLRYKDPRDMSPIKIKITTAKTISYFYVHSACWKKALAIIKENKEEIIDEVWTEGN